MDAANRKDTPTHPAATSLAAPALIRTRTLAVATLALAAATVAADRLQAVVGVGLRSESQGVQYYSQPWGFPYFFLLLVIATASLVGVAFRAAPSRALLVALWGVLLGLAALEVYALVAARSVGFGWGLAATWILQPRFAMAPIVAGVAALMGAHSSPRRQSWS